MKKLIISLLLLPSFAFAFTPQYQGLYQGKYYDCVQLRWNTQGVPSCYIKNGFLVKSIGTTIKEWTGIYDSKMQKIFRTDTVNTIGIGTGTVTFENNKDMYGYFIYIGNNTYYNFKNLEGLPISQWSTIITK